MTITFIKHQHEVDRLLPILMERPAMCLDTETTGLDPHVDKVTLFQIGDAQNQYILDTRHVTIEPLRPYLESTQHRKIFHNANFDYRMIRGTFGISTEAVRDTFLAEKILNAGRKLSGFSLADVCALRCGVQLDKSVRKSFIGYRGDFSTEQIEYAAKDIIHLFEISRQQSEELMATGLNKTYILECEAVPCFADMEFGGFRLDVPLWKQLIEENRTAAHETVQKMNEMAKMIMPTDMFGNVSVNYGSPKQVLDMLHRMRVTIPERMADGSERDIPIPDSNENTLNKVTKKYPIIDLLKDLRGFEKKVSTYGQSFIDAIHPVTKLIHGRYDQIGTATGRPASSKESPFNPMNIPRDKRYRQAFLARTDSEVVETDDYSGCELRIWAELSQDPGLIEAYSRGVDIHCYAATKLFGVEVTKTTNKHLRTPAKSLNFGIIYGMGPKKLYFKLNAEGYPIEFDEAKKLYYRYVKEFDRGISYLRDVGKQAVRDGYLTNLNGRRRYWVRPNADDHESFPLGVNDPKFHTQIGNIEREGGNFVVQSCNADMTKLAMVNIRKYKKQHGVITEFYNQVYDEIVTSTHKDHSPSFVEVKRKIMTDAAAVWLKTVKMEVEGNVGPSWTK